MASKTYRCVKWPSLGIGRLVFVDGVLSVDNEVDVAEVEKHEQFGRAIVEVKPTQVPVEKVVVSEPVAVKGASEDEPVAANPDRVRQGFRGTGRGRRV